MLIFKYCSKCGSAARPEVRADQLVPVCQDSKCGFIFWQNSKPCVVALIANEQGRVLMTVRGMDPDKGKLDLPGGFLYNGELPEDGVRREVEEELGVKVEVGEFLGHFIDKYPYQSNEEKILTVGYAARIVSGQVRVADPHEIAGIEWIDPAIVTPSQLAFEGNEKFLAWWRERRIVKV